MPKSWEVLQHGLWLVWLFEILKLPTIRSKKYYEIKYNEKYEYEKYYEYRRL